MTKERKKVLIVDNSIDLTGALKAILYATNDLRDTIDFIFLLPSNTVVDKILEKEGFKVYKLPFVEIGKSVSKILLYIPFLILNSWKLSRIVKREKIEIIHANDFFNLCPIYSRLFYSKVRIITHIRLLATLFPASIFRLWVWHQKKFSDVILCNSNASAEPFAGLAKSIIIYERLPFNETHARYEVREKEVINLLYLSNYIKGKGQDLALEAFAKAFRMNNKIRLTFVGGDMGLEKNKNFKNDLIARSKELNINEFVSFESFVAEVENKMKQFDIVLNFSESESFSRVNLEALFYGIPVIASDCGGPRELFENNKSGLLVPNRDINAMAEAIVKLSSDLDKRVMFSVESRKYVNNKFSRQETSGKLLQLYNRILS